jgi:hypothetical protein
MLENNRFLTKLNGLKNAGLEICTRSMEFVSESFSIANRFISTFILPHRRYKKHLYKWKCFFSLVSVAVVIAFFCCWAPHHAQRLYAIYANNVEASPAMIHAFYVLTYISGILYFVSTCINPLLYNIMSYKFREAFKVGVDLQINVMCARKRCSKNGSIYMWRCHFRISLIQLYFSHLPIILDIHCCSKY